MWCIIIQCGIDSNFEQDSGVVTHRSQDAKTLWRPQAGSVPPRCRWGSVVRGAPRGTWCTPWYEVHPVVRGAPGGVWRPSPTVLLHTPGGADLGWMSARAALERELETGGMEMFLGG